MSAAAPDTSDDYYMGLALAEAQRAVAHADVPVGAVVVQEERVIGRGHNRREVDEDPTAHAEIIALQDAARAIGSWRLVDARLYVTLEPCPMCAGALVNARIKKVIYGCSDPKAGALRTLYQLGEDPRLNHRFEVISGVRPEDCAALLKGFFARLRSTGIE